MVLRFLFVRFVVVGESIALQWQPSRSWSQATGALHLRLIGLPAPTAHAVREDREAVLFTDR